MAHGPCNPTLTTPDRIVVLIRHSVPVVDPDRPAFEWSLSDEGISALQRFWRPNLSRFLPAVMFSSPETKAIADRPEHIGLASSVSDSPSGMRCVSIGARRRFFHKPSSTRRYADSSHPGTTSCTEANRRTTWRSASKPKSGALWPTTRTGTP